MDFFDFDGELDSELGFDLGLNSDYTPEALVHLNDQYNVSFGANKTINGDVYLDTGRTITLEPAGGGLGDKVVDVYVKSGKHPSKNRWC